MFMVDGTNIILSRGDTGAVKINAVATLDGAAFTFGADDRALFSVKNSNGEIIMQKAYTMTDNSFTVYFQNEDTEGLAAGSYSWDVRYVVNAYFDASGNIVNGDQIITPKNPMTLTLLNVVGDV
jgi:hypothetical protein